MGLFDKLTTEGMTIEKDSIGGGSRYFESGIYEAVLNAVYTLPPSEGSNAMGIVVEATMDGRKYRETFYVTNRKGENFYTNSSGNKVPLPGFVIINDLCLCTTGKPLAQQETENRVFEMYSRAEMANVATSVPTLVDLLNQKVWLGVVKQEVNKRARNQATGAYEPINEKVTENVVDKVFHYETKMTTSEATDGKAEAKFFEDWKKANDGRTRNRFKEVKGSSAGTAKAPASAPAKSLFAK